jgi:hypothetical protein
MPQVLEVNAYCVVLEVARSLRILGASAHSVDRVHEEFIEGALQLGPGLDIFRCIGSVLTPNFRIFVRSAPESIFLRQEGIRW